MADVVVGVKGDIVRMPSDRFVGLEAGEDTIALGEMRRANYADGKRFIERADAPDSGERNDDIR
jgi:hypothetical protein